LGRLRAISVTTAPGLVHRRNHRAFSAERVATFNRRNDLDAIH
jgi:hypothetical protein